MRRLHSLDALRGVAALAVVVWHWQHFFALHGVWAEGWQRSSQPLFWLLKPLYEAGWVAVDLFFALSGFVFFWLYAGAIRDGAMKAGRFALLRLSRLYPLHLASLLLVVALQTWFRRQTGRDFIFESQDWTRFAAALLMAQQWLPPSIGQFFNGPAWSVSVEALLYICFFLACRAGMTGPRAALAIVLAAGGFYLAGFNMLIARGVMGFFLGGLVFYGVQITLPRADARNIARVVAALAILAWVLAIAEDYTGMLHGAAYRLSGAISDQAGAFYIGHSDDLFLLVFIVIVSPLTLAALALHEHLSGGRYQTLSFLGDISYSTYLLHFPLQLVCVLVALRLGWTPMAFMTPWAMLAFFSVLIGLGVASHYGFEKPMQRLLRAGVRRTDAVVETA